MSDTFALNIEEILRDSIDNYEKALKSGIKLREDTISFWKDVLPKIGSPEDLKAKLEEFKVKLEELGAEVLPAARKQLDEVIATLRRTGEQVLSLSEKTVSIYTAPTLPEAQSRLKEVSESYFAVARENLNIAFDANARVIGYWKDLAGRFVPAAK
jgi:hypothetical protein